MWENIKTEIYLWYIRTFKTRHCKVPEGWTSITSTYFDDDEPVIKEPEKPVFFGKWRLETDEEMPDPMFKLVVCTNCNETANSTYMFCPNCGKQMFNSITEFN